MKNEHAVTKQNLADANKLCQQHKNKLEELENNYDNL